MSEKSRMEESGAFYTGRPVEKDGFVITADGPGSATLFTRAIIATLKKE